MSANTVILYDSNTLSNPIEVFIEDETVWLTQLQMAVLFSATKQNISLHIGNIFKEGELKENSTVKEYLTAQNEGIFDAYELVARIIKSAQKSIILIDNYCDESVLLLLSKRAAKVKATIYTNKKDSVLELDIEKHNQQYDSISLSYLKKVHDRFLIIDNKELCHFGASLKDLGKKWFAFSKLQLPIAPFLEQLIKQ